MITLLKDDVLFKSYVKQHTEHIENIKQIYRSSLKKKMNEAIAEANKTKVMLCSYLPKHARSVSSI